MGKQEYEIVMSKVDEIAVAVNKFPDSAQGMACKEIISALISDSSLASNGSGSRASISDAHMTVSNGIAVDDWNEAENLERYADNFDLVSKDKVNNIQFAAFVAYFYCEAAPDGVRVDAIDKSHLETASDIVGRDLPGASTLSDAKTKSGYRYLVSKGRGKYALSHAGKRYVKNDLLKRE